MCILGSNGVLGNFILFCVFSSFQINLLIRVQKNCKQIQAVCTKNFDLVLRRVPGNHQGDLVYVADPRAYPEILPGRSGRGPGICI